MDLSLVAPAFVTGEQKQIACIQAYWDKGKAWESAGLVIYRPPITINYQEDHRINLFYDKAKEGKYFKMFLDPFLEEKAPKGWYGTIIDDTIHCLVINPYGWNKEMKADPKLNKLEVYEQPEKGPDPCFIRSKGKSQIVFCKNYSPQAGDRIYIDAIANGNLPRGVYWIQGSDGLGYKVIINGDNVSHGKITGIIECEDILGD